MKDKGGFIWTLISLAIMIFGVLIMTDPSGALADSDTGIVFIFVGMFLFLLYNANRMR